MRATARNRLKPKKKLRFETDIVGHCNLNCKGCTHFSPLADECFVTTDSFEKDFARLSELAGRDNENIDIMGGEPLLHPEISTLVTIARKYFDGPVNIVTNGILLSQMNKHFWDTCRDNKIRIVVTNYPIILDKNSIKSLAKKYNVKLKMRLWGRNKHTWCRLPFDLSGEQDVNFNIKVCIFANSCIFLKNGKLSTCCLPLIASRFNDYFGKTMIGTEKDYIDIYKTDSITDIYQFLSKPIPFCRYCRMKDWEVGIEWGTSKKKLSEWV
jgi:hypothetical protein